MLLRRFTIFGHSMLPYLAPGETIIASSIPYFFSSPKIGDIIVFKYNKKVLIKRIGNIQQNEIFTKGDNSKDSLEIGKVSKKDILGKYMIKI